jgi:ribosomal protein S18 acetylase RimI-like enzyme
MDIDDIAIERIAVEDLREDRSGVLIEQIASLAYRAFREPPWNDDLERARLHFGLGVDLMRRNAVAFIAKAKASGKIAGYALGYEVLRESEDPRDLTLRAISGTGALDYLFEGGNRVFYGDTLCVDPDARRRQIAYGLVAAQIPVLRGEGFAYRIGRTAMNATAMRGLFAKLGFEELAVRDAVFPERSYWLLTL